MPLSLHWRPSAKLVSIAETGVFRQDRPLLQRGLMFRFAFQEAVIPAKAGIQKSARVPAFAGTIERPIERL
jgi:hypothetical protein